LTAKVRVLQHNLLNFFKAFNEMDDLVISVTEDGLVGSGTLDKAFFVTRWSDFREGEECAIEGEIPIGQLKTFISLIRECGAGNDELEINLSEEGLLTVTGDKAQFTMPSVTTTTSQAGVSSVQKLIDDSEASGWKTFGTADIAYSMSFDGSAFQQLRNTGKTIQNGALYCLEANVAGLTLSVKRDSIRMESTLEPTTNNLADESEVSVVWFGKWLMDALKAMPSEGTVHLHGGEDSPLLIRHESPDGKFGTQSVIAPRQDEAGDSQ